MRSQRHDDNDTHTHTPATPEMLEVNLQKLRNNVATLEDDLRHFSMQNNTDIRQQQVDNRLVGERKQELDNMKGRINALLRCERDRIRELKETVAKAKEGVRSATERKQLRDEKMKRAHGDEMKAHMSRFKAQSQRHNTQLSVYEAKQDLLDYNRMSQMEAKKFELKQKAKMRQLELQGKIKNMQNVIKAKMFELATMQSNKSQLLMRRVEVSKRLKKKKDKNNAEFARAKVLLNYSLDVENAIKSNIEMASQLKDYYERVCQAAKLGTSVDFEASPEVVAEQLGFQFNQVPIPSDMRIKGAQLNRPLPIVGQTRYPTEIVFEHDGRLRDRENSLNPVDDSRYYERSEKRSQSSAMKQRNKNRHSDSRMRLEPVVEYVSDPQKNLIDLQIGEINYTDDTCGVRVQKKSSQAAAPSESIKPAKDPFKIMAGLQSPVKKGKEPKKQSPSPEMESRHSEYHKIESNLSNEDDHADKFYMRGTGGFQGRYDKKRRSSAHE